MDARINQIGLNRKKSMNASSVTDSQYQDSVVSQQSKVLYKKNIMDDLSSNASQSNSQFTKVQIVDDYSSQDEFRSLNKEDL